MLSLCYNTYSGEQGSSLVNAYSLTSPSFNLVRGVKMKRLTTEDFIRRAVAVHGDKYNYSLVEYQHAKAPVTIICKEHGAFEQLPNNHLYNGANCPACGLDSYVHKKEGTKVCAKCGEEKAVGDFYWSAKDRPNGGAPYSYCKSCCKNNQKKLREVDPKAYMWKAAKTRAKRSGIPFNISVDDFEIPTHCPIFGIELVFGKGQPTDNSPSLDKIIPSLGYVKGNVEVISHRANSIKRDATPEELQLLADYYNG